MLPYTLKVQLKVKRNVSLQFYIKGHNQEGHRPRRVSVSCVTNVVTNDSWFQTLKIIISYVLQDSLDHQRRKAEEHSGRDSKTAWGKFVKKCYQVKNCLMGPLVREIENVHRKYASECRRKIWNLFKKLIKVEIFQVRGTKLKIWS